VCLNDKEGEFILQTIKNHGAELKRLESEIYVPNYKELKVDSEFIANKNKLSKKSFFSSESDLEAFIMLNFKNNKSTVYNQLNKILSNFQNNNLSDSKIYNQFIFGNAYPSDIVISNQDNINILELKKTNLQKEMIVVIKKEIKKYCCYSLYSERLEKNKNKRINFFLMVLSDKQNLEYKKYLENCFKKTIKPIACFAEFNFAIIEYSLKNQTLLFHKI